MDRLQGQHSGRGERKPSSMYRRPRARQDRGQIIIIFALALVVLVGMVGLLVDGGAVFAQQRVAQNGSDGAATAGALVVAQNLGPATRTGDQVYDAIDNVATETGLQNWTAIYTDDFGDPIGQNVVETGPIPAGVEGVQVRGERAAGTTFSRVLGVSSLTAGADATVVAGNLSGECVADEDGCALLPITFPIKVPQCDGSGNLLPGRDMDRCAAAKRRWPGVLASRWRGVATDNRRPERRRNEDGHPPAMQKARASRPERMASSTSRPDRTWRTRSSARSMPTSMSPIGSRFQTGNPNSVEDEILEPTGHQPVLIPLHNQTCQEDPGDTEVCSNPGVDPTGNNTWYYVHTLGVFFIDRSTRARALMSTICARPARSTLGSRSRTAAGSSAASRAGFVNYVDVRAHHTQGARATIGQGSDRNPANPVVPSPKSGIADGRAERRGVSVWGLTIA